MTEYPENAPGIGAMGFLGVLRRRWGTVLLVTAACMAAGILWGRSRPKMYEASARLLLEPRQSRFLNAEKEAGSMMYYFFYRSEIPTQLLVIHSEAVAKRVVGALNMTEEGPVSGARDPAAVLRGLYRAETVGDTRVIEVTCKTTDPEWAARIATKVAHAYIEESAAHRKRLLNETMGAYRTRAPELYDKLDKAEGELIRFQEEHPLISSDRPEEAFRQEEQSYVEQQAHARRERVSAEARLRELSADGEIGRPHLDIAVYAAGEDARVRHLLDRHLTQRGALANLAKSFSDGHPDLESAKAALGEIERELDKAARSYYERLRSAYNAAVWKAGESARLLKEHREQMSLMSSQLLQHEALRQRRDSLRDLLEPLARSQTELEIAAGFNLPNASVKEEASAPTLPCEPNLLRYGFVALLLGLGLGSGLALALDAVDETVRTPDDVARAVPIKVLGTVSLIARSVAGSERDRALATAERPDSVVAEQFRSIRTGILSAGPPASGSAEARLKAGPPASVSKPASAKAAGVSSAAAVGDAAFDKLKAGQLASGSAGARLNAGPWEENGRGRVVLVTSPGLADGKTTVSINAAAAFAQLGQGVVLVDADMRRPKAHEFMDLPRSPGIVEVLEGECELADALRQSPIEGLAVLTAGRKTERPAELAASGALRDVLDELRRSYGFVWVDSPPVVAVADASIIAPLADMILVVVRSTRTKRRALARTHEILAERAGPLNVPTSRGGDGRTTGTSGPSADPTRRVLAVLNGAAPSMEKQYGYHHHGYHRSKRSAGKARKVGTIGGPDDAARKVGTTGGPDDAARKVGTIGGPDDAAGEAADRRREA